MTTERRNALMVRWSVLLTLLIAGYWTFRFFTDGYVPSQMALPGIVTYLGIAWPSFLITPISRWWDLLLGPMLAVLIFWANKPSDSSWFGGLVFLMACSALFVGLLFGVAPAASIWFLGFIILVIMWIIEEVFPKIPGGISNIVTRAANYMMAKDKE